MGHSTTSAPQRASARLSRPSSTGGARLTSSPSTHHFYRDNGSPTPDPITASGRFDVTYPVILGNHFGFRGGRLELVHTINDQDSPMGPQYVVRQGQLVRLHINNMTDEIHTMHLHGHHFSVLTRNGQPLRGSPVRLDSLLVEPHESWDVAFVANNPGLWMFHCHVLVHAEFGMSGMVVYQGVVTPYEIGSRSSNKPE